jgi:type IV secretory pathway component VirB8
VTLENLSYLVGIVVVAITLIAWLIRLEAKVMYLERDFNDKKNLDVSKEQKIWEKMDEMRDMMTNILQSLARVEGKIESKK